MCQAAHALSHLIPTSQHEVTRLLYLWDLFTGSHLWCSENDHIKCHSSRSSRWRRFPHLLNLVWLCGFLWPTWHSSQLQFLRLLYKVHCMKEYTEGEGRPTARARQTIKPSASHQWLHPKDWDQTTCGGHRWAYNPQTRTQKFSGCRFKLLCSIVILLMRNTDSASIQKSGNGG